jgi:hypothetical protein
MSRGGRSLRALIALVAIGACSAAVAYAASRPVAGGDKGGARATSSARSAGGRPAAGRPPKPKITAHPETETTTKRARFAFTDRRRGVRFACRLDRGTQRPCRSPLLARVGLGRHLLSVRAVSREGVRSAPAKFRWTRLEPKRFSIEADLAGLGKLYPGAPPSPLPLTVVNPNSVPIELTELHVAITADPPGCPAENLALAPAGVTDARPLVVPARGSVRLPAGAVAPPAIQLRDLPVNQDACQGTEFPLEFTGSARG